MKSKKKSWTAGPAPRGSSGMIVTNHSGGESQQLDPKSFDGRNRVFASSTGGTKIAEILSRPGKHVPQDEGWKETPSDHFVVNSGPNFRSGPEIPKAKSWRKK
jgi:hypothetical protein